MLNISDGAKLRPIDPFTVRPSNNNPRSDSFYKDEAFVRLRESVASYGVLVPIIVRTLPKTAGKMRFSLVDGERRWRAACDTNLRRIPAYVLPPASGQDDLSMMFQVHMHQEGWDAVEQVHSLEKTVTQLQEHAAKLGKVGDDVDQYVLGELVSRTGMSRANALSRLRFFRWPKEIRQLAYERDDEMLYSYMVEIEANILEPAQRNYPELFQSGLTAAEARKRLYDKTAVENVTKAAEVRAASVLAKRRSNEAERRSARSLLRKLIDDTALTFLEAQEQYFILFPDEAAKPAYSTRKLVNLCRLVSRALDDYTDDVLARLKKRQREVFFGAVRTLHTSTHGLVRRLKAL